MPTYTYRCKKCGKQFDKFQSIVEKPLTVCPDCGGKIERVITGGSGLIFKGTGFYITDYKNKNVSEKEKPEKKPETTKASPKSEKKETPAKEEK